MTSIVKALIAVVIVVIAVVVVLVGWTLGVIYRPIVKTKVASMVSSAPGNATI